MSMTSTVPPAVAAAATSTRRLLDARQVAELIGCSWRTVLRLADAGKLPAGLKIGALRRWDAERIEQWIADGCKPVRTHSRP